MMKFKYFSMVLCLASASVAHAELSNINSREAIGQSVLQERSSTCSGIVKTNTGETIIGASIAVKGQSKGTVSDLNGDFKLANVPPGTTIVIS